MRAEYCPSLVASEYVSSKGGHFSLTTTSPIMNLSNLYQASEAVSPINLVNQSYYEKAHSKLNTVDKGLNTQLCWLSHNNTDFLRPYLPKEAVSHRARTIKYCTKYGDSLAESVLLVEHWTTEYTTAGLLRITMLNSNWPTSRWRHSIFSRQLLDLLEALI